MSHFSCSLRTVALSVAALAAAASLSSSAFADSIGVSYYGAGVQSSPVSSFVESFDSPTIVNGNLISTFNGSNITGTYSGGYSVTGADLFGGAGGSGKYITTGTSYTLSLSSSVNYFGLWISALDNGNQLTFYNGSNLLYTFTPAAFSALVGACPTTAPSPNFCGNPNTAHAGNTTQQYAFLNFYDFNGTFNKVVFTETPQVGGFESDNHTVGNLSSAPGGMIVGVVPEPSTFVLLGTGLAACFGFFRRRPVSL